MGSAERTSHDAITQMLIQAPSATMERIRGRIASLFGVANIGRVMLREGSGGELVMEIHVKPGELIAMMRSDQAEEGAADPEALRQAVDEAKAEIYREIYGDLPCASPRLKPLAPEQLLSQAAATTGEKDEPPP